MGLGDSGVGVVGVGDGDGDVGDGDAGVGCAGVGDGDAVASGGLLELAVAPSFPNVKIPVNSHNPENIANNRATAAIGIAIFMLNGLPPLPADAGGAPCGGGLYGGAEYIWVCGGGVYTGAAGGTTCGVPQVVQNLEFSFSAAPHLEQFMCSSSSVQLALFFPLISSR